MSRLQPHSFVGGSNYDTLGNVAGPRSNFGAPNALNGTITTLAGVSLLTAGSFLYGIVKKKPTELNMGYLGATFLATLPVATDMWLNNGERYGSLTGKGLALTYVSLITPPVVAIFAGSQIGGYVASQRPKSKSSQKAWYEGRYASRTGYGDNSYKDDDRRRKQTDQNRRRKKGRNRNRKRRKQTA
jgi:hypothetical protein